MFVKKKRNRAGSTTVAVVSKDRDRYHYIKVIGTSSDAGAISSYIAEGRRYISEHTNVGSVEFDFDGAKQRMTEERFSAVEGFLDNIESVLHDCHRRILDSVFDAVGFGSVGGATFRSRDNRRESHRQ